jgi:hypothetical protein
MTFFYLFFENSINNIQNTYYCKAITNLLIRKNDTNILLYQIRISNGKKITHFSNYLQPYKWGHLLSFAPISKILITD